MSNVEFRRESYLGELIKSEVPSGSKVPGSGFVRFEKMWLSV